MADMEVCRVIHPDGVRRHGIENGDEGDVIDLPPSLARSWAGRKVEILDDDPREQSAAEDSEPEETESPEAEEPEPEEAESDTAEDSEPDEAEEPEADTAEDSESEAAGDSESSEPETEEWPKPTGSGWFELPNGEKVQGEEAANEKLEKLREEAE